MNSNVQRAVYNLLQKRAASGDDLTGMILDRPKGAADNPLYNHWLVSRDDNAAMTRATGRERLKRGISAIRGSELRNELNGWWNYGLPTAGAALGGGAGFLASMNKSNGVKALAILAGAAIGGAAGYAATPALSKLYYGRQVAKDYENAGWI